MTEHIDVDGKKFVKASIAADRIGYTPDYVTRLARSKKIDACRSGRVWYVDLESLKLFSLNTEAEKRQRNEELREARLRERGSLLRELHEANIRDQVSAGRASAFAQTAVLATSLFLLFNLVWIAFESRLNVENIATGLSALVVEVADVVVDPIVDTTSQFASFAFIERPAVAESQTDPYENAEKSETTNSADPNFQGVVLFEENGTTSRQLDAVRESFSDEVNVEFDGTDTGIVTPVFRERKGDTYRFLLVPIRPPGS